DLIAERAGAASDPLGRALGEAVRGNSAGRRCPRCRGALETLQLTRGPAAGQSSSGRVPAPATGAAPTPTAPLDANAPGTRPACAAGGPWLVGIYSALGRLRNQVKTSWSKIDVQRKRRHDLIPSLVETVKGYAGHERTTLESVVKARNQAMQAQSVPDRSRAESELSGALGRLMVVMEQYPDLKAKQNFLALQEELSSTENRI